MVSNFLLQTLSYFNPPGHYFRSPVSNRCSPAPRVEPRTRWPSSLLYLTFPTSVFPVQPTAPWHRLDKPNPIFSFNHAIDSIPSHKPQISFVQSSTSHRLIPPGNWYCGIRPQPCYIPTLFMPSTVFELIHSNQKQVLFHSQSWSRQRAPQRLLHDRRLELVRHEHCFGLCGFSW